MKKRTVLITGDLAAGKTTFAKKLSKHLGIAAICKDEIKEILAETVGFSNRAENKRLSQAAFKIILNRIESASMCQSHIIAESNFTDSELQQVYDILDQYGIDYITYVLRCSPEISYKRYCYRNDYEDRHFAHWRFNSEEEYIEYLLNSRDVSYRGIVKELDANDFRYQEQL